MKLPLTLGLVSLFAVTGCDEGTDTPDDSNSFRHEGGSTTFTSKREAGASFKQKGCDPDWWFLDTGDVLHREEAPEEWLAMVHLQATRMADEVMASIVEADSGIAEECTAACEEAGAWFTGEVGVLQASYDIGETVIVGECPFGASATETDVFAEGIVACECEG